MSKEGDIRPSLFLVKRDILERRGGTLKEEYDDYAVFVFPDGSGCTLDVFGRVEWFKAV